MGSACAAGAVEPSHVLLAMGRTRRGAQLVAHRASDGTPLATRSPQPRRSFRACGAESRAEPSPHRAGGHGEICDERRVLVAMSGGVDSSVAAAMLLRAGLRRGRGRDASCARAPAQAAKRSRTCCSHDDFEDARRVSERMGFPFYVIDLRADFGARVIGNFVSEYLAGRTPNPCVMCNREIKFDRSVEPRARARRRICRDRALCANLARRAPAGSICCAPPIRSKDQSYFLFTLGQARTLAHDVPAWRDDQDRSSRPRPRAGPCECRQAREPGDLLSCPTATMREFRRARSRLKRSIRAGHITRWPTGNTLADHAGIHRFTVGQRRGLGIAAGEPLYVREIRAEAAR